MVSEQIRLALFSRHFHWIMSKSIQLMNKNADRDVSATLHAGKKPGTTDVLLDVKTRFPIHFFGSFLG